MNKKRKLELMEKYDFHGFGCSRMGLEWGMGNLLGDVPKKDKEESIENIRQIYKRMTDWYAQINFDELKKEMGEEDKNDFAALFKTREILARLKIPLENLLLFAQNNKRPIGEDEPIYTTPYEIQQEIIGADNYGGRRYRERIEKLKKEISRGK